VTPTLEPNKFIFGAFERVQKLKILKIKFNCNVSLNIKWGKITTRRKNIKVINENINWKKDKRN
jgi:hypothetical protein